MFIQNHDEKSQTSLSFGCKDLQYEGKTWEVNWPAGFCTATLIWCYLFSFLCWENLHIKIPFKYNYDWKTFFIEVYVIFFQNPELKSQTSLLKNNMLLKKHDLLCKDFYDLKAEYIMKNLICGFLHCCLDIMLYMQPGDSALF